MGVFALALSGCLYNHSVEVDKDSIDVARGAASDLRVIVDGVPLLDLEYVLWEVDDPALVTVLPAWDGMRLRVGGDREGVTIVHVQVHGQTVDIPTLVGPPAIKEMWIEPTIITSNVGEYIPVRAMALDTTARLQDLSHDSRWTVRDPGVVSLDTGGMMLHAQAEGRTTLHATNGEHAMVVPITIYK
jgi:hypothetical protein